MSTLAGPRALAAPRGRLTARRLSVPMLALLGVEFVLGMVLNLFVALPSGAGVVSLLTSTPVLDFHLAVALLLIGISARAVPVARREPSRVPLGGALLALVSAIVATGAGWVFTFDGQSSGASFTMSMGFLGILVGAVLLLGAGASGDPAPTPRPEPSQRAEPAAEGTP